MHVESRIRASCSQWVPVTAKFKPCGRCKFREAPIKMATAMHSTASMVCSRLFMPTIKQCTYKRNEVKRCQLPVKQYILGTAEQH